MTSPLCTVAEAVETRRSIRAFTGEPGRQGSAATSPHWHRLSIFLLVYSFITRGSHKIHIFRIRFICIILQRQLRAGPGVRHPPHPRVTAPEPEIHTQG
jgi:hypothetical protein